MANQLTDDNFNRSRSYGKRVGDIIAVDLNPEGRFVSEVVSTFCADNNRIIIKWYDGTLKDFIAEYADIIIKVEERLDFNLDNLEEEIIQAFKKMIATPDWKNKQFYTPGNITLEDIDYKMEQFRNNQLSLISMINLLMKSKFQIWEKIHLEHHSFKK